MPDGSCRVPFGAGDGKPSDREAPVAPAGNGGDDDGSEDDEVNEEQRRDAVVHEMHDEAEQAMTEMIGNVPPVQLGLALEAHMETGAVSPELAERLAQRPNETLTPVQATTHAAEIAP